MLIIDETRPHEIAQQMNQWVHRLTLVTGKRCAPVPMHRKQARRFKRLCLFMRCLLSPSWCGHSQWGGHRHWCQRWSAWAETAWPSSPSGRSRWVLMQAAKRETRRTGEEYEISGSAGIKEEGKVRRWKRIVRYLKIKKHLHRSDVFFPCEANLKQLHLKHSGWL